MQILLKARILERIGGDDALKLRIAQVSNVKLSTVERWLRNNDVQLTTAINLFVIGNHTGTPETKQLLQTIE